MLMLLIRFIDLLTLPMAAPGMNKGACHFDVASHPFKCHFALMWLSGMMKNLKLDQCS